MQSGSAAAARDEGNRDGNDSESQTANAKCNDNRIKIAAFEIAPVEAAQVGVENKSSFARVVQYRERELISCATGSGALEATGALGARKRRGERGRASKTKLMKTVRSPR